MMPSSQSYDKSRLTNTLSIDNAHRGAALTSDDVTLELVEATIFDLERNCSVLAALCQSLLRSSISLLSISAAMGEHAEVDQGITTLSNSCGINQVNTECDNSECDTCRVLSSDQTSTASYIYRCGNYNPTDGSFIHIVEKTTSFIIPSLVEGACKELLRCSQAARRMLFQYRPEVHGAEARLLLLLIDLNTMCFGGLQSDDVGEAEIINYESLSSSASMSYKEVVYQPCCSAAGNVIDEVITLLKTLKSVVELLISTQGESFISPHCTPCEGTIKLYPIVSFDERESLVTLSNTIICAISHLKYAKEEECGNWDTYIKSATTRSIWHYHATEPYFSHEDLYFQSETFFNNNTVDDIECSLPDASSCKDHNGAARDACVYVPSRTDTSSHPSHQHFIYPRIAIEQRIRAIYGILFQKTSHEIEKAAGRISERRIRNHTSIRREKKVDHHLYSPLVSEKHRKWMNFVLGDIGEIPLSGKTHISHDFCSVYKLSVVCTDECNNHELQVGLSSSDDDDNYCAETMAGTINSVISGSIDMGRESPHCLGLEALWHRVMSRTQLSGFSGQGCVQFLNCVLLCLCETFRDIFSCPAKTAPTSTKKSSLLHDDSTNQDINQHYPVHPFFFPYLAKMFRCLVDPTPPVFTDCSSEQRDTFLHFITALDATLLDRCIQSKIAVIEGISQQLLLVGSGASSPESAAAALFSVASDHTITFNTDNVINISHAQRTTQERLKADAQAHLQLDTNLLEIQRTLYACTAYSLIRCHRVIDAEAWITILPDVLKSPSAQLIEEYCRILRCSHKPADLHEVLKKIEAVATQSSTNGGLAYSDGNKGNPLEQQLSLVVGALHMYQQVIEYYLSMAAASEISIMCAWNRNQKHVDKDFRGGTGGNSASHSPPCQDIHALSGKQCPSTVCLLARRRIVERVCGDLLSELTNGIVTNISQLTKEGYDLHDMDTHPIPSDPPTRDVTSDNSLLSKGPCPALCLDSSGTRTSISFSPSGKSLLLPLLRRHALHVIEEYAATFPTIDAHRLALDHESRLFQMEKKGITLTSKEVPKESPNEGSDVHCHSNEKESLKEDAGRGIFSSLFDFMFEYTYDDAEQEEEQDDGPIDSKGFNSGEGHVDDGSLVARDRISSSLSNPTPDVHPNDAPGHSPSIRGSNVQLFAHSSVFPFYGGALASCQDQLNRKLSVSPSIWLYNRHFIYDGCGGTDNTVTAQTDRGGDSSGKSSVNTNNHESDTAHKTTAPYKTRTSSGTDFTKDNIRLDIKDVNPVHLVGMDHLALEATHRTLERETYTQHRIMNPCPMDQVNWHSLPSIILMVQKWAHDISSSNRTSIVDTISSFSMRGSEASTVSSSTTEHPVPVVHPFDHLSKTWYEVLIAAYGGYTSSSASHALEDHIPLVDEGPKSGLIFDYNNIITSITSEQGSEALRPTFDSNGVDISTLMISTVNGSSYKAKQRMHTILNSITAFSLAIGKEDDAFVSERSVESHKLGDSHLPVEVLSTSSQPQITTSGLSLTNSITPSSSIIQQYHTSISTTLKTPIRYSNSFALHRLHGTIGTCFQSEKFAQSAAALNITAESLWAICDVFLGQNQTRQLKVQLATCCRYIASTQRVILHRLELERNESYNNNLKSECDDITEQQGDSDGSFEQIDFSAIGGEMIMQSCGTKEPLATPAEKDPDAGDFAPRVVVMDGVSTNLSGGSNPSIHTIIDDGLYICMSSRGVIERSNDNLSHLSCQSERQKELIVSKILDNAFITRNPNTILTAIQRRYIHSFLPLYLQFQDWRNVYSTSHHGVSLSRLLAAASVEPASLLVIEGVSYSHGQECPKSVVFGAFLGAPAKMASRTYYGSGETFVFQFNGDHCPSHSVTSNNLKLREMMKEHQHVDYGNAHNKKKKPIEVYRWTTQNNYFVSCSREMMAIGGPTPAIYLDHSLMHGSSGYSATFGCASLCQTSEDARKVQQEGVSTLPTIDFDVTHVELYGFSWKR